MSKSHRRFWAAIVKEKDGRTTSHFIPERKGQASEKQVRRMITKDWGSEVVVIEEIVPPSDGMASNIDWEIVLTAFHSLDEVMKPQPSDIFAYFYYRGFMARETAQANPKQKPSAKPNGGSTKIQ